MDLRRLRTGEYLLALAGVVLVVSLFLSWYEELTGWEALGAVDVILALLAACALSVAVVTAVQRVAAVPIALDAIATLAGLVALVLVLLRVIDLPDGATGREVGLWLALAAAAGIVVGGALAMRDERISAPGRPTDATGRPIAQPVEVEALPAPPRGSAS
ncbi:MAG TPA: hypothetical protein VFQ12_08600 [Thermoleophilaceae bacterium]|nr:hypothetical protein [Thermoleophilaceae bacterium]